MDDFEDLNDNLLDEDDALDYVMYEKVVKNEIESNNRINIQNSGCCVTLLVLGAAGSTICLRILKILS